MRASFRATGRPTDRVESISSRPARIRANHRRNSSGTEEFR